MNTVKSSTLNNNLCINCGICKVVCPYGAIELKPNKYGEYTPFIDKIKCKKCGLCKEYCPNTIQKIKAEATKVANIADAQTRGLENAAYYVAWSNDKKQRQQCCSGGIVTEIASYLLSNHLIDGMIHVERVWSHRGDLHYRARLSFLLEEIKTNVSSAYQPIDFSKVLAQLESGKTYFVTGTPCVIRGLKNLFEKHKKFKDIKIITCALICSHTTNSQFIDYLTEINNISDKNEWQVNIRQKDDNIPDANNFNNHIYTKTCDLMKKNRFESNWTNIWRAYYFAMNSCLYCSDFWGYCADISIKDAWGEWAKDPLGKSIVVIRNKTLMELFLKCNITYENLDYETMKFHQFATSEFKQIYAKDKNFKSFMSKTNRNNKLFRYKIISMTSKFLYKFFGYKITQKLMLSIEKICDILEKF